MQRLCDECIREQEFQGHIARVRMQLEFQYTAVIALCVKAVADRFADGR